MDSSGTQTAWFLVWEVTYTAPKNLSEKDFQTSYTELDVASAIDVINDLGFDTLTFLVVTVMVVPAFKLLKASPVANFLKFAYFSFFLWIFFCDSSSNFNRNAGLEEIA